MKSALWSAALVLLVTASAGAEPAPDARSGPAEGAPVEPRAIYSVHPKLWIRAEPNNSSRRLGYVRAGGALELRAPRPVKGPGCVGGYYAVEPRGYVCHDRSATLDAGHRYLRAMRLVQPGDSAVPFRYAISNGAPMYQRLPSRAEWERAERDLGEPGTYEKYPWNEKHERLAEERAIGADGPVPFFLKRGGSVRAEREKTLVRRFIPLGSMLAYSRAFEHAGRVFLLSSDGTLVPADRVRPYRESAFRGARLRKGRGLPLAWIGQRPRPSYRRDRKGRFIETGVDFPARARLGLVSSKPVGGHLETTEHDESGRALWISAADATVVEERKKLPYGVAPGQKWIEVHVTEGTLVAYEGDVPVFATLISPGRGGVSRPGTDPVEASTTPRGSFRIQYKYRTQTMSPDKDKPPDERTFWIADVPYAQYFRIPFALHTAYWHEDFGDWMSGGCVNLSPTDGAWLFRWTDPELPEHWDAVWAGGANGKGTRLVITR